MPNGPHGEITQFKDTKPMTEKSAIPHGPHENKRLDQAAQNANIAKKIELARELRAQGRPLDEIISDVAPVKDVQMKVEQPKEPVKIQDIVEKTRQFRQEQKARMQPQKKAA